MPLNCINGIVLIWWRWRTLLLSVPTASSSERHLLSCRLSTLSLKTVCYTVFTFGSSRSLNLGTLAFNSRHLHFACQYLRERDIFKLSLSLKMVEMAGIEPASENSSTRFSPSAVIVLGFPRRSAQ